MSKNSDQADYRVLNGEAYRDLEKQLLNCDRKYGPQEWFRWLMDDVLADLTGDRKTDPPPASVIDELREVSGLYAKCVIEAPPFTDVLGSLYMTLASHGAKQSFGQYFTPAPVAEMMAEMQKLATAPKPNGGLWRVTDPAVGSGVMLLSAARILYRRDPESLQSWSLTGVDIDRYCALMCACQLLANVYIHRCTLGEIAVYRGNSLGPLTADNMTVVLYAVADPNRAAVREHHPALPEPLSHATDTEVTVERGSATEAETPSSGEPGQLNLFFD